MSASGQVFGVPFTSVDLRTAAQSLGCSEREVRRACETGAIEAIRLTDKPRSRWRIPLAALQRYITRMTPIDLARRVATATRYPKRDAAWWKSYWEAQRED